MSELRLAFLCNLRYFLPGLVTSGLCQRRMLHGRGRGGSWWMQPVGRRTKMTLCLDASSVWKFAVILNYFFAQLLSLFARKLNITIHSWIFIDVTLEILSHFLVIISVTQVSLGQRKKEIETERQSDNALLPPASLWIIRLPPVQPLPLTGNSHMTSSNWMRLFSHLPFNISH